MHVRQLLLTYIVFILFHSYSFAQKDSVRYPGLKIFANVSLAIITGWEPENGTFYSKDWYEGGQQPHNFSAGFHYGIIISKRIFSSSFYIASGIEMSSYSMGSFRLKPAHDPRYTNSNITIYDTSYGGYTVNSFQVPLYFQVPLVTREIYFALRAGVVNDFIYADEYTIEYTQSGGSSPHSSSREVRSKGMRYGSARLHLGCDLESKKAESRLIVLFSSSLTSGPLVSNQQNKNFLRYGAVFSVTLGFGYCFVEK